MTDDQILPAKKPVVETNDATGISGPALRLKLQRLASRSLLIVREDNQLADFVHETEKMRADLDKLSRDTPNPLRAKYELRNLMLTGKAIATAARIRNESRGSHYRKDHPEPNNSWNGKIIVCSMRGDKDIQCRTERINAKWNLSHL